MIDHIQNLFSQNLHCWILKTLRKRKSSLFLTWSIHMEDAEVFQDLPQLWMVEECLKV